MFDGNLQHAPGGYGVTGGTRKAEDAMKLMLRPSSFMRTSPELWITIRGDLFAQVRVMLLFFSFAISFISFFIWVIWAGIPNPKPDIHLSFTGTLKTFRKDFGMSRDADLLPAVPLPVSPVKLPVSLPVFSPPERLVANGPLPVSGLPSEPVRLALAGK